VNFTGTVTPPVPLAAASSRATSLSRTSLPLPSPMPLLPKQLEGSHNLTQELCDREKFDLHYGVATKDLQEVLGMLSLHNTKCS